MEAVSVVIVVVVSVGLAFAAHRFMKGPSVRRAFARHPVTDAADVTTPGRYRLTGRVVPVGEPLTSEASGRPYVARDLRLVASAGDSGSTRVVRQAVDFLLDDGTTRILVRTGDAVVAINRDFEAPKTALDRVPWVDPLLRASGYHNGSPSTCTIRLYEGVLAPGAHAGVLGYAGPADDHASALGASLVVPAGPGAPVMIRAEEPTPPEGP